MAFLGDQGPCYSKCGLGPVLSALPGKLVDMQILMTLPDLLNQILYINIPRSSVGTFTFEKLC